MKTFRPPIRQRTLFRAPYMADPTQRDLPAGDNDAGSHHRKCRRRGHRSEFQPGARRIRVLQPQCLRLRFRRTAKL